jgi:hypothetical protein
MDQNGNIKFLSDIAPDVPTTKWSGIVRIPVSLSVPSNVPVGNYKVVAGLYSGSSSVPLTPAVGVVPYGNNTNRYQVGTLSILKSASGPSLASTASVINSVPTPETNITKPIPINSTPTTYSSPTRRNYRSGSAPASVPAPSSSPAPTPSASPVSSPVPARESHSSSPTTTASPVTSVPSAPAAPAPAPASEPAPAPVVSSPSPSSTPVPSASPVSEGK